MITSSFHGKSMREIRMQNWYFRFNLWCESFSLYSRKWYWKIYEFYYENDFAVNNNTYPSRTNLKSRDPFQRVDNFKNSHHNPAHKFFKCTTMIEHYHSNNLQNLFFLRDFTRITVSILALLHLKIEVDDDKVRKPGKHKNLKRFLRHLYIHVRAEI